MLGFLTAAQNRKAIERAIEQARDEQQRALCLWVSEQNAKAEKINGKWRVVVECKSSIPKVPRTPRIDG